MELAGFFEPVDQNIVDFRSQPFRTAVGDSIQAYTAEQGFPSLEGATVALIGVKEDRGSVWNRGCAAAPDHVRHYLYRLAPTDGETKLVDLGNLMPGHSQQDTYAALSEVVQELAANDIPIALLGGSEDLAFAVYKAYEALGRVINICSVDSRFNLDGGEHINSENYLQHIILQQPNYLFDYLNAGYQTYLVGQEMIQLMDDLKFTTHRLGELQANIELAEPLVRYADMVAVDVAALRQSDAPANGNPSPHGFYGEQLCQIARFAGMSDKTSCFGLFEMLPSKDRDGQTAHLLAHALWFFIEGCRYRLGDFPSRDSQQYKRFTVALEGHGMDLVFYKSLRSDRWWIEVPCEDTARGDRYQRHTLVPCHYNDYLRAMENEIPELWWHYYNRLNG